MKYIEKPKTINAIQITKSLFPNDLSNETIIHLPGNDVRLKLRENNTIHLSWWVGFNHSGGFVRTIAKFGDFIIMEEGENDITVRNANWFHRHFQLPDPEFRIGDIVELNNTQVMIGEMK